jgi:glyoxylase-like metal-dependent hydrolase (beta-lactamase superfamily II)
MTLPVPMSRRLFLAELGRGTVAIAVVGIAACTPAASQFPSTADASATGGPSPDGASPATTAAGSAPPSDSSSGAGGGVTWERVDLGFVSAYVLARAGEAAVVDTGESGSEDDIAAALERIGLGWDAVGHVIVTHRHGDHAGSLAAVLAAAPDATGYAGAEDLAAISAPQPLVAVADGDDVFGLTIVATPGHTAGHVAVLDEVGGILVAGDALGTAGGAVRGPNAQFTDDMATALASVAKLGTLRFDTLLVGHGDPIVGSASDLVAAFDPS